MSEPRYRQLARSLASAVREGHHPAGSLLPTEMELAEQYGVSRHTVREALKQLQSHGMISRRVGVGTRVESWEPNSPYRQSLGSIGDLVQFGERHRRVVEESDEVVLDIATAGALECAPGSRWLWMGTVRWDEDSDPPVPVSWTDNYVDPIYEDIGTLMAHQPSALICTLIEQRHRRRAVRVNQSVTATGVPEHRADVLRVPAGSPALMVVRQYLDEMDDPFIVTMSIHPEHRFKLRTTLTRDN